jgi:hypothetical protein
VSLFLAIYGGMDLTAIHSTKHSSFSTAFPIFLWTEKTLEVPDDDVEDVVSELKESATPEAIPKPLETSTGDDDEAAIVEEEDTSPAEDATEETKPQKMKSVQVAEWVQANPQPPLWMRDPKEVTDDEYKQFYQATFKDYSDPLAWYHFSGDSGTGTSFRAMIYVPSILSVISHIYLPDERSSCLATPPSGSLKLPPTRTSGFWSSVSSSLRTWVMTSFRSGPTG